MPIYTPHEKRQIAAVLIGGTALAFLAATLAVTFAFRVWWIVL